MAAPDLGLCWGSAPGADIPALIELAARHGFAAITVTAGLYQEARAAGHSDAALRRHLADAGVRVTVVDPLIGMLPGTPRPAEVQAAHRKFFEFTEADCHAAAEGLRAETVNMAHFLGRPVPLAELAACAAGVAERAAARGLTATLEFIPDTGVPDLATAVGIVRLAGRPNLSVLVDSWHLARSGGSLGDLEALAPGAVGALQISDRKAPAPGEAYVPMSGRLPPGDGELPLAAWLRAILAKNPGLNVGVEVFSGELTALGLDEAVRRLGESSRRVLAAVG
jgi:sugar phosphate isomerase/epimerase